LQLRIRGGPTVARVSIDAGSGKGRDDARRGVNAPYFVVLVTDEDVPPLIHRNGER
jgi:hypothetical protein